MVRAKKSVARPFALEVWVVAETKLYGVEIFNLSSEELDFQHKTPVSII